MVINVSVAFFCWSSCPFICAALSCRIAYRLKELGLHPAQHPATLARTTPLRGAGRTAYALRRLRASRANSSSPFPRASSARRYQSSCATKYRSAAAVVMQNTRRHVSALAQAADWCTQSCLLRLLVLHFHLLLRRDHLNKSRRQSVLQEVHSSTIAGVSQHYQTSNHLAHATCADACRILIRSPCISLTACSRIFSGSSAFETAMNSLLIQVQSRLRAGKCRAKRGPSVTNGARRSSQTSRPLQSVAALERVYLMHWNMI